MLAWGLRDLALIEDLVLVGVEHDVVHTRPAVHEAIPERLDILKSVVEGNDSVWVAIANSSPSIVIELFQFIGIDHRAERFVEKLDGCNDIRGSRISLCKRPDSVQCVLDGVTLLPGDRSAATTVVKTILRARGWWLLVLGQNVKAESTPHTSVQVKHDLQVVVPRPANSLIKDRQLPLNVWVARQWRQSPVSDGNPHVVESSIGDLPEVVGSNPRVPVLSKTVRCFLWPKCLAVCELVDDGLTAGPFIEDGRRDPWLQDKPATKVDAVHLVVVVVEVYISALEFADGGEGQSPAVGTTKLVLTISELPSHR